MRFPEQNVAHARYASCPPAPTSTTHGSLSNLVLLPALGRSTHGPLPTNTPPSPSPTPSPVFAPSYVHAARTRPLHPLPACRLHKDPTQHPWCWKRPVRRIGYTKLRPCMKRALVFQRPRLFVAPSSSTIKNLVFQLGSRRLPNLTFHTLFWIFCFDCPLLSPSPGKRTEKKTRSCVYSCVDPAWLPVAGFDITVGPHI